MSLFLRSVLTTTFIISLLASELYANKKPLTLGIFPYLSMTKIIKHNKKLKQYLEKELQQPIEVITSKDFKSYLKAVKEGTFDLLFTAPHIGRYAELKAHYHTIAATRQYIQGYFIVKKNASLQTLADAKGKIISMAPDLALVHQTAVLDLKNVGITLGENITYLPAKTHTQALINLIKAESDLALSGVNIWKKLPAKHRSELRILKKSAKLPGFLLMAHQRVAPKLMNQIKKSLLKFHHSKEGIDYLFKGYELIDKERMKALDHYIKDL